MNVAQEIYQLLHQSWNYCAAAQLYDAIGDNAIYKILFASGENSYNTEKLQQALKALEPSYPFQLQRREPVAATLPEDVLQLESEAKKLYKEANHLRTEIFKRNDTGQYLHQEKERGARALQIKANMKEVDRLYAAVDYFREHGYIPHQLNQVEIKLTDRFEIKQRIRNLGSYISKAKAGKKTYKMTISEMETEKAALERELV